MKTINLFSLTLNKKFKIAVLLAVVGSVLSSLAVNADVYQLVPAVPVKGVRVSINAYLLQQFNNPNLADENISTKASGWLVVLDRPNDQNRAVFLLKGQKQGIEVGKLQLETGQQCGFFSCYQTKALIWTLHTRQFANLVHALFKGHTAQWGITKVRQYYAALNQCYLKPFENNQVSCSTESPWEANIYGDQEMEVIFKISENGFTSNVHSQYHNYPDQKYTNISLWFELDSLDLKK